MSSELIVTVTDGNFQTEVMESEIPVLVDFWAEWCGPCKALGPVLKDVAEERKDKIKICKVNVEENATLATQFDIRSIPLMVFIHKGKKVAELIGNQPKVKILAAIDKLESKE